MKLLLTDGCDTLWEVGFLYEKGRQDFSAWMAERHKYLTPEGIYKELDTYDAVQAKAYGLLAVRVTNSMMQIAYNHKMAVLNDAEIAQCKAFGEYPFTQVSPLKEGAQEFLQAFHTRGIPIILVTAGDQTIQTKRIDDFPYRHLFSGARIVDKKTPELFRQILQDHGVQPQQAWMVGNSYFSDIVPARGAGLHTALLHSYTWAYDNEPQPDLTEVLVGATLLDIRDQILDEEGL